MENNDADKKETDESTPQRCRKPEVKFAPKILPKKMPKIIPKREPHEENKVLTIDRKMMTGIGSLQITDNPRSGAKAEKQGDYISIPCSLCLNKEPLSRFHLDEQTLQFQGLSPLQEALQQDYNKCTNYPVTLPVRWPNSGDTESLDEEEFSRSLSKAQDGELTAAEELGLMERVDMPQLLFFQFPTSLSLPRETDPAAETETNTIVNGNAKSMGNYRKRMLDSSNACSLKELSGGLMGKILVYNSGKVKMMLGDALFDVAAGSSCMFAQEVVPIDTREKHCCSMGELGKRAIVTPDIDYCQVLLRRFSLWLGISRYVVWLVGGSFWYYRAILLGSILGSTSDLVTSWVVIATVLQ